MSTPSDSGPTASAPSAYGSPVCDQRGSLHAGTHSSAPERTAPASDGLGNDRFSQRVRQRFGRRAAGYEDEARLQQAIARRLARLSAALPLPAGPCADLGAGTGLLSRALQQHHPQLRERPPLQLDLCPDLLAINPLAGVTDPLARHNRSDGGAQHGLIWDLNQGLPDDLNNAALMASSFALQWLEHPARSLALWCRSLRPGGWLVLAVPTSGSFPQWHRAAERAGVACTALALPDADTLLQTAQTNGLRLRHGQRHRFSRPQQGGLRTLRHLQRLGASASRGRPLTAGEVRRLLRHWPETSPLTWEVLLLIGQPRD